MISDDVYVRKAAAGDDEAFDELVKHHHAKIYEVAHRIVNNPKDAENITQETFSRARQHIKAFQGQTQFGTWVYRIGANTARQYSRREA